MHILCCIFCTILVALCAVKVAGQIVYIDTSAIDDQVQYAQDYANEHPELANQDNSRHKTIIQDDGDQSTQIVENIGGTNGGGDNNLGKRHITGSGQLKRSKIRGIR
ncbi:hypothetical protein J3Q64DRAFT_1727526 [Phycomyces blakesleeanus]|uniref:Secreted protein n=1 Tax=Phycomyces blakesleeanus TaxID=4837 RepID=A0ABR3B3T2_PHYBL